MTLALYFFCKRRQFQGTRRGPLLRRLCRRGTRGERAWDPRGADTHFRVRSFFLSEKLKEQEEKDKGKRRGEARCPPHRCVAEGGAGASRRVGQTRGAWEQGRAGGGSGACSLARSPLLRTQPSLVPRMHGDPSALWGSEASVFIELFLFSLFFSPGKLRAELGTSSERGGRRSLVTLESLWREIHANHLILNSSLCASHLSTPNRTLVELPNRSDLTPSGQALRTPSQPLTPFYYNSTIKRLLPLVYLSMISFSF